MPVKAKKHLGQHFLTDESIAENIANSITEISYDYILEIGPGMGILTKYLLQKQQKLTVIEIDSESVLYLQKSVLKKHIELQKLKIIEANFLTQNIASLFQQKPFAVIGNFPYNISSQIVFKILENRDYIPEFAGMFQKEVAQRITEKEGSKVYGILSVLTQAFYEMEYLFTVPSNAFYPPPKVESGVIKGIRKKDYKLPVNEQFFFKIVKVAFNQRRKMLRSSLKSLNITQNLREESIFAKRPEQLSVNDFIELTQKIATNGI